MKKWHYKNVFIKGSGLRNFVDLKDLDDLMNRMGADGWEFVSTIKKDQDFAFAIAVFKRERSD
jgi:hypothetical protein